MQQNETVDARGLACPLPLLRARLALNALQAGQVLRVLATDAGASRDIPSFCRLADHQLLHEGSTGAGELEFLIRKQ